MSLPDEELLSAYLDGELTADERSRVERLLAESPESRQLLDELRSIKTSLERMSRARLGHDFADQVLRQAEKELLTAGEHNGDEQSSAGNGDGGAQRAAQYIEPAERAERLSGLSWQRLRRPVIWASLTLAAGLLIMFIERDPGRQLGRKQVAMAPADVRERDRGEVGIRAGAAGDEPQNLPLATPQAPDDQTGHYRRADPMSSGGGAATDPVPPMAPESRTAGSSSAARGGLAPAVGKPAQLESDKDAGRMLVEKKEREEDGDAMQDALTSSDEPLVVWCEVAPGTNYSASFRDLLAEQNIQWNDEKEVAESEVVDVPALKAKLAKQAPSQESILLERAEPTRQKRLADAEQAVRDPNTEVVLVEASQPQIEAVLAAIDGATKVFINVDVEPSPDAPKQQQQLMRYARGYLDVEKLGELADESKKQLKKKVDAPSGAPAAKPAATEANQNQLAGGNARRLMLRSAAEAGKSAKRPEEKSEELPPIAQLRLNKESDVKMKSLAESRSTLAAGLGANRQATDQGRVQVLFVLHPAEQTETSADAKPDGDKK
jgi:hypothetical protein